jgi:hypothetical protein
MKGPADPLLVLSFYEESFCLEKISERNTAPP